MHTSSSSPSLAVFSDPRASTLLLGDTIQTIITRYRVERAGIDLSTVAGLTVATEFLKAGIAYEVLTFTSASSEVARPQTSRIPQSFQMDQPRTLDDAAYLFSMSAGTCVVDMNNLGEVDANIVMIPAMADERLIDFSANTVMGQLLVGVEAARREALIIVPPERGLRPVYESSSYTEAMSEGATSLRNAAPSRYERQLLLLRDGDCDSAGHSDVSVA